MDAILRRVLISDILGMAKEFAFVLFMVISILILGCPVLTVKLDQSRRQIGTYAIFVISLVVVELKQFVTYQCFFSDVVPPQ